MKNSLSKVNQRREEILGYLREEPSVNNEQLAERLNTSTLTIRRDLQHLEDKGIVKRFYGGAVIVDQEDQGMMVIKPTEEKALECNDNRARIAKCAAGLINEGDIIFINSSSTALDILKYIGDKKIVVVTNNGSILQRDLPYNVEVMLTGGQVNRGKHSMVGDFALYVLQHISAVKCFLGVSGIDYKTGISTAIMQETLINKEMIKHTSGNIYIVAESSKILKPNNFSSGSIDQINTLITDTGITIYDKEEFGHVGVEVITV